MPAENQPTQPLPAQAQPADTRPSRSLDSQSRFGERPGGVIHDIGYQRYTGPRLGRGYAARSLYVHSLRTAFGLGRSAKAKVFPWMVVGLAFAIATVAVAVRAQTKQPFISYLTFTDSVAIPTLLFLAIVAPELVSRELRAQVLPLYFSRPLRRADYALVKLAAMVSAVWLLLAGPQLLMFIGGLFSRTDGLSGDWRETLDFLGGVAYSAIGAVVFAALAILVASLAGRRAIASASIAAVFLVTTPVVGVLVAVGGKTGRQIAPVLNPVSLIQGLKTWLYHSHGVDVGQYGYLYLVVTLVLVSGCVALLLARYRKVAA